MGWLFGKKKSKVPFPQGQPLNEGTLRFPDNSPAGKVIEPNAVKKAVGFDADSAFPPMPDDSFGNFDEQPLPQKKGAKQKAAVAMPPPVANDSFSNEEMNDEAMDYDDNSSGENSYQEEGPLFVKVDVYQRVLGELDDLKHQLNILKDVQHKLEDSEYNEERNFDKLRKSMKVIHDQMLQVDRVLFKAQE